MATNTSSSNSTVSSPIPITDVLKEASRIREYRGTKDYDLSSFIREVELFLPIFENTNLEDYVFQRCIVNKIQGEALNIIRTLGNNPTWAAIKKELINNFGIRETYHHLYHQALALRNYNDHPKGLTGVVAHKSKLFKREIMAYKEILPRAEELLASIGDTTKIAPACYYTTETPEPFLILEDMNLSGFENFARGRLLNLDYVLPTIEKLAKLHACSAVIAAENLKIMEFFEEAPISRNPDRKDFLGFYPVNIRCVAEEISQWKGYEEITEKMFKLAENILQTALHMYEEQENGFRVFNVADMWIDNLMFHVNNETKEPDDVILLDFQLCYYGSPAMDLNYFLYGSLNENVRKVHMKYIVREYHRTLKETLEKLNYDGEIPTLKEITIEMIKNSLQGVVAATCLTPIIFMEKDGFETIENLTLRTDEGDEVRRQNVENPKYKAFLQRTLKEFELNGFLDV